MMYLQNDCMNRNQLLLGLVIVLALFNVVLFYKYYFETRPGAANSDKSMHSWLDKTLELTDSQEVQHVKIRNAYFEQLRTMNDSIKQIKSRYVAQAAQFDLTDSLSTYWNDSINRWYRRANELTYRHMRNVRTILTDVQKPKWDSLMQIVILRKDRK